MFLALYGLSIRCYKLSKLDSASIFNRISFPVGVKKIGAFKKLTKVLGAESNTLGLLLGAEIL